jgi:RNA polymerase sigma-70 factor (family 1)
MALKNESELLQAMSAGNADAFSRLYKHYASLVYRFIYKYLKSEELTDDLTQEIFIKIWENRSNLSEVQAFKSYLFTLSRNHAINFLRRASVDVTAKGVILHSYQPQDSIEDNLQTKQYLEYLNSVLATLSPQSREVFRLCRQEYKSYDEAAEILGITRHAIKKHMVKSMKIIGTAVQKDLGIPLSVFLAYLIKL